MPRSLFGNLDVMKDKDKDKPSSQFSTPTLSTPTAQKQDGFFTTLAKGVAKPFATTAVTGLSALEDTARLATGKYDANTPSRTATGYNVPWLGQVKPAKIGTDVEEQMKTGKGPLGRETLKTIGTGAELASWYGGGAGMNLLRQGLKGAALKKLGPLAFAEAKLQGAAGLAGGAGSALQEDDATLGSVAKNAVIGGALGSTAGALTTFGGAALGKAWKGVKGWNEAADQAIENARALHEAEKASKAARGIADGAPPEAGSLASLSDDVAEFIPPPAPKSVPMDPSLQKKAVNAGFKEWQATLIGEMSPAERASAREMVKMAKDKNTNIMARHPIERAAEPLLDQVEHLRTVRDESGPVLDGLVDEMTPTPVSLAEQGTKLDEWLGGKKIDFKVDQKGRIKGLDFSRSKFSTSSSAKDRVAITEAFHELFPARANGQAISRTPEEIRTIRQRLRLTEEANTKASDPFSSETETMLGSLRTELNKPLVDLSPAYAEANQRYAVAKEGLEDFYKFLGRDFYDASKDEMSKRVQELLPRLVSNTSAKPEIIFKNLLEAAQKTGMASQAVTDPRRLLYLANMLDSAYDLHAPRGYQGSIEGAMSNTLNKIDTGIGIASDVARMRPLSALQKIAGAFSLDGPTRQRKVLDEMLADALTPSAGIVDEAYALGVKGANSQGITGGVPEVPTGQGANQAFGGVAGIEPEYDENGKPIGLKYDPVKGALGVAGGIAFRKAEEKGVITKGIKTLLESSEIKEKMSRSQVGQFLKRAEFSEIDRGLMQKALDSFEKDAVISKSEFADRVLNDVMTLKRVETDKWAKYGGISGQEGDYGQAKTIIYDSPIKHGETGHFSEAYGKINDAGYEVKKITHQGEDIYTVLRKGVPLDEENIQNAVANQFTSKAAADKWVEAVKSGTEKDVGLFGHVRLGIIEPKDLEPTIVNAIEFQADPHQRGSSQVFEGGPKEKALMRVLDNLNPDDKFTPSQSSDESLKSIMGKTKQKEFTPDEVKTRIKTLREEGRAKQNLTEKQFFSQGKQAGERLLKENIQDMAREYGAGTKYRVPTDATLAVEERFYSRTPKFTKEGILKENANDTSERIYKAQNEWEKNNPREIEPDFVKQARRDDIYDHVLNFGNDEDAPKFISDGESVYELGESTNGRHGYTEKGHMDDALIPYDRSVDSDDLSVGDNVNDHGMDKEMTVVQADRFDVVAAPADSVRTYSASDLIDDLHTQTVDESQYEWNSLTKNTDGFLEIAKLDEGFDNWSLESAIDDFKEKNPDAEQIKWSDIEDKVSEKAYEYNADHRFDEEWFGVDKDHIFYDDDKITVVGENADLRYYKQPDQYVADRDSLKEFNSDEIASMSVPNIDMEALTPAQKKKYADYTKGMAERNVALEKIRDEVVKEVEAAPPEVFGKDKNGEFTFDPESLVNDNAKAVVKYYKDKFTPLFRKLRKDAKLVTDEKGRQWWETILTAEDKKPLVAFGAVLSVGSMTQGEKSTSVGKKQRQGR